MLALLAILAASVAADSSSEAVIARNRLGSAQARALADAGITLAITGLLDPNPATRWLADGHPQTIRYGDGTIAITLQVEGGKIDLNKAPIDLIASLLNEFGVSSDEQSAIASGILERREAFAPATPQPAVPVFVSTPAYTLTDVSKLPFADESELRLVSGMTRAAYDHVRPFVTVYSESPTINPQTAPREVLLGIPGISPQDVEFFLEARDQAERSIEKPTLSGANQYAAPADSRSFTATVKATTTEGASFTREAVIMVSSNFLMQPFRIVRWRQAVGTPPAGDNSGSQ